MNMFTYLQKPYTYVYITFIVWYEIKERFEFVEYVRRLCFCFCNR